MDPLLVLVLLGVLCMAAMVPMMLFGPRRWMGPYIDRTSALEPPAESVQEILDRRYATGEITRESYRAMLADLEPRAHAK